MKQEANSINEHAALVLKLSEPDIRSFISECIRKRSLNALVSDLNHDLLNGSPTERKDAAAALTRIGFV